MDSKFERVTVELTNAEAREIAFALLHDLKNTLYNHWKSFVKDHCTLESFKHYVVENEKDEICILNGFSKIINIDLYSDYEYEIGKVYKEKKTATEAADD